MVGRIISFTILLLLGVINITNGLMSFMPLSDAFAIAAGMSCFCTLIVTNK